MMGSPPDSSFEAQFAALCRFSKRRVGSAATHESRASAAAAASLLTEAFLAGLGASAKAGYLASSSIYPVLLPVLERLLDAKGGCDANARTSGRFLAKRS